MKTSRPSPGHRRLTGSGAGKYQWPPGWGEESRLGTGPGLLGPSTARKAAPSQEGTQAPKKPHSSIIRQKRRPGSQTDSLPFPRAGTLTAAVTSVPPPPGAAPRIKPAIPHPPRLPSHTRAAGGGRSPLPPGCGGGDCSRKRRPASLAAGGSGRGRSPPPDRPAVSPLSPAPPPSAVAAAATVTSALARPSLPHCAAAEGRKARPLSGEGAGRRGRSRPTP